MSNVLNRLTKWRAVFAGWQLGTRSDTDPECQAVRNHRELSMLLRVEVTALTRLMVEKGLITVEEYQRTVDDEAEHLMKAYERRFPGFKATDIGMDINIEIARDTMQGWRP